MSRPTPFDLVFRQPAEKFFPNIRLAMEQAGHDPRERDRFLMVKEVVTLLHQLRPDEGLGAGIDQLAALIHHAYLFWDAQEPTINVTMEQLPSLVSGRDSWQGKMPSAAAYYAAMPEYRLWAQVIPEHPPEPMDGCFVHSVPGGTELRVLGVFGIQPERDGFSVVEAAGERPLVLRRMDGSEPYAPTLIGGAAAGLFSMTSDEELLDLGWRTQELGTRCWELRARGSALGMASSMLQAPSS
jgi:hypothetical protein